MTPVKWKVFDKVMIRWYSVTSPDVGMWRDLLITDRHVVEGSEGGYSICTRCVYGPPKNIHLILRNKL